METRRPSPPAPPGPRRGPLPAAALGLLVALTAAAGPPGGKSKEEARPLDRGPRQDLRAGLLRAAAAYSGAARPQAPVLDLAQALAHVAAREAQERFWFDRRRTAAAGAAQVVGAAEPFLAAAMRLHGSQMLVWDEAVPTQAPPLHPAWLDAVRDGKPFLDLRERAPDELLLPQYRAGYREYLAYCQAILLAAQTPADAFARSAADNPDLGFNALYTEPARHRGKVVHLEGRLKRVSRYDAPLPAQRHGVKWVYEGWIFLDRPGPPVVVIFPELPPELKLGDYPRDRTPRVTFDGYFFKKYRYRSGEKDRAGNFKDMVTLLFIGPTLARPARPAQPAASPLSAPVLYGVLGFLGFTILLLVAINLWYRRSDRQIRARLQALQGERFLTSGLAEMGQDGEAPGDGAHAGPDTEARAKNGQSSGEPGELHGP
jgi:hypothetical protein